MDLLQVLNGVQRHVSAAYVAFNADDEANVKDNLADAAGLIQREIGDADETPEKQAETKETPQAVGHCQSDQKVEESS